MNVRSQDGRLSERHTKLLKVLTSWWTQGKVVWFLVGTSFVVVFFGLAKLQHSTEMAWNFPYEAILEVSSYNECHCLKFGRVYKASICSVSCRHSNWAISTVLFSHLRMREWNFPLHPRSLTWPLKHHGWKITFLLGWLIFSGYVKLPGSTWNIKMEMVSPAILLNWLGNVIRVSWPHYLWDGGYFWLSV